MRAGTPGHRLRQLAGVGVVWLPVLVLLPASLLDRGPSGRLRLTGIYLVLTFWDPFTWLAIGHSLALATIVTAGAILIGVPLASSFAAFRSRGRSPLAVLACFSIAVPPLCGALGLRPWLGSGNGRWLAILWTDLIIAVPWVARSVEASLNAIDPRWEEVGELLGASRWQIRRDLVWPLIRPAAAHAAAMVFGLCLVEPGAVLVLGLRRTLAFQIVEAASRSDGTSRAAILAIVAVAFAGIGRRLLLAWGRPYPITPIAARFHAIPSLPIPAILARLVVLALWFGFALGPVLGLIAAAIPVPHDPGKQVRTTWERIQAISAAPAITSVFHHSLRLGVQAACLALILGRLSRRTSIGFLPPLVTAVAFTLLPSLPWGGSSRIPRLAPEFLMSVALGAIYRPLFPLVSRRARGTDSRSPRDASLMFGASRRRTRLLEWRGSQALRYALVWLSVVGMASIDTVVPLLFGRSPSGLTLGTEALKLSASPAFASRASTLAIWLLFVNGLCLTLGLGIARRPDRRARSRLARKGVDRTPQVLP